MSKLTLANGRYEGMLADGRLLCILPDVFEMNRGQFPETELYDPNEWVSSVDGENCWIEDKESGITKQDLFKQDDFRQQYELAKQAGDKRYGSECKHIQTRNGYCVQCLRKVVTSPRGARS